MCRRSTSPISIVSLDGTPTEGGAARSDRRVAAGRRAAPCARPHADRLKRPDEALDELRRASGLEPDRARYVYVYAVALHSAGRGADAIAVLRDNLTRHPDDRDTLSALVNFNREARDAVAALDYAERLARLVPAASPCRA